jgi:hypothetical protein
MKHKKKLISNFLRILSPAGADAGFFVEMSKIKG